MKKEVQRALADKKFMAGVREAQAAVARGERGTPWKQIEKELGLEV